MVRLQKSAPIMVVGSIGYNVNHWRWWGNNVPSTEITTKLKLKI